MFSANVVQKPALFSTRHVLVLNSSHLACCLQPYRASYSSQTAHLKTTFSNERSAECMSFGEAVPPVLTLSVESSVRGTTSSMHYPSSLDFLSNALQNFIRQLPIVNGASQHNTAEQRRRLKDHFLPIPTVYSENFLKSFLQCGFDFRS